MFAWQLSELATANKEACQQQQEGFGRVTFPYFVNVLGPNLYCCPTHKKLHVLVEMGSVSLSECIDIQVTSHKMEKCGALEN